MKSQEIKKLFRNVCSAHKAFDNAMERLEYVRSLSVSIKSVIISDMPRCQGDHDKLGRAMEQIEECTSICARCAERYTGLLSEAYELISLAHDGDGIKVIQLRWFNDVKWDDIPEQIHMDRSSMFRHYENAVSEIEAASECDQIETEIRLT